MDGTDYINIYSKGLTLLGRALSNFSEYPIKTIDGTFMSVEGYWYWLNSDHENKDQLRRKYGYDAKEFGRKLKSNDWNDEPLFKLKIAHALLTKLISHDNIYQMFKTNQLEFVHYYEFGNTKVVPTKGKWVVDIWNFVRELIHEK